MQLDKNFMFDKSEGPASILKKILNENTYSEIVQKSINYKGTTNYGTDRNKTDANKTDINKTDTNKTDTNKTDTNKTNINKANINKANINRANINNTEESGTDSLTEGKSSIQMNSEEANFSKLYIGSSEMENRSASTTTFYDKVSPEKLQETIIWTEILGKPVSRRHRKI